MKYLFFATISNGLPCDWTIAVTNISMVRNDSTKKLADAQVCKYQDEVSCSWLLLGGQGWTNEWGGDSPW